MTRSQFVYDRSLQRDLAAVLADVRAQCWCDPQLMILDQTVDALVEQFSIDPAFDADDFRPAHPRPSRNLAPLPTKETIVSDNDITIIGNLTREPELRFTTSGKATCSFGIAVNRRYMQNNEWVDAPTNFFNVTVWAQYAENAAASLNKGDRVMVKGRLDFRKYTNKEGVEVTTHDIQADEVCVSLKFATCTVERTPRAGAPSEQASSSAPRERTGGRPADPIYGDEEPF